MKQWRVGIIGVGAIGTSGHLIGYRSAGANVVAVADVAEGRAAKVYPLSLLRHQVEAWRAAGPK